MTQPFEIKFYNRYTQKTEIEKVYGSGAIEFAYNSVLGKGLAPVIAGKMLSKIYGKSQDTLKSGEKVAPFLKSFSIQAEDYQKGSFEDKEFEHSFKSFNEFFIRKFKAGKRDFSPSDNILSACAEARYFGHEAVTRDLKAPVKGHLLDAHKLLENPKWGDAFKGGPLLVARLCPVDYHRYHYPDGGKTIDSYPIHGDLHSVNPLALKFRPDIFIKNERRVSILQTENFGKLALIEVGATCVGKIVQSFDESLSFKRGDEKGYFLFGGSTVIICGEAGRWKPCSDILENTKQGLETYIHLGDKLGLKIV